MEVDSFFHSMCYKSREMWREGSKCHLCIISEVEVEGLLTKCLNQPSFLALISNRTPDTFESSSSDLAATVLRFNTLVSVQVQHPLDQVDQRSLIALVSPGHYYELLKFIIRLEPEVSSVSSLVLHLISKFLWGPESPDLSTVALFVEKNSQFPSHDPAHNQLTDTEFL